MPVISFVSSKGGAGKTTATVLLACELAMTDKVIIIDADERSPVVAWSQVGPYPSNVEVIACADDAEIQDAIDYARRVAKYVLVDVKGEASLLGSYAMQMSDFVVVPSKEQVQDAKEAVGTLRAVHRAGRGAGRIIPSAVLLTQSKASVKSRTQRSIGESLRARPGVHVLGPELVERDAFMSIFAFGGGLRELDSSMVNGVSKAIDNVRAVKDAILSAMRVATEEQEF